MDDAIETAVPRPVRIARILWRAAFDPAYRDVLWLRHFKRRGAFQPHNNTRPNRYPRIFDYAQSELGRDSHLKILSFGCSTGDEVFSLRQYFPRAFIKGIDINPGNIAQARSTLRRQPDSNIVFAVGSSVHAEADAVYDAIFCMAVFRHGDLGQPGVMRCDHLIRFADFAGAIDDLCRCLKSGGLLAIRSSNFRLCDTPAAAHFDTVLRLPLPEGSEPRTPLFGPDNARLAVVDYPDTVFRKISAAAGA